MSCDATNTVYGRFAHLAAENPTAAALTAAETQLNRIELLTAANAVAAQLPQGARRVGVAMDHGAEMIAALLGILQVGAAYVPVEPDFPQDRIEFMMADAEADCIITQDIYSAKMPEDIPQILVEPGFVDDVLFATECSDAVPSGVNALLDVLLDGSDRCTALPVPPIPCAAEPNGLAYILYTSGSTGKPKGVAVRNRNLCHYARAFAHEFSVGQGDVMLQYSVCSFDIFAEEVFATLLNGGAVAIPAAPVRDSLDALMAFCTEHGVTIIDGFPYLLQDLNGRADLPPRLRLLISGGDVLRASYVDDLVKRYAVYNTYGPSETTVCASYFRCDGTEPLPDGTYPIGKAVLGASIVLLDGDGHRVKPGEAGEICMAGDGVSAGYVGHRPTEQRAFERRSDGSVLYHSGDMAYELPDGNLAFLHRKDRQIMIWGKRVEPDEVETVLARCPGVRQSYVETYKGKEGLDHLAAFVTPEAGAVLKVNGLKASMGQFLPAYMIPETFVVLEEMPLTPNGKVDAHALETLREG